MPFNESLKKDVLAYCMRDLPNDKWYQDAFCFIKSEKLKNRLIAEFKNVRLVYKIFEGLSAEDELLLAEVRMQILMYASIYEAVIHYVLFDEYYKENPQVKKLLVQKVRKQFDIPGNQLNQLNPLISHDGKTVIPYYETVQKRDITKIRFDEKCRSAFQLGILAEIPEQGKESAEILPDLKDVDDMPVFCAELIRIYEIRNAIHIQAELKKQIEYHLLLSKIAYRRMQPFLEQIKNKLFKDGFL